MDGSQTTLKVDISYDTIDEGDRWAFYIHELGITCYADREEQGEDTIRSSIGTVLDALQRDPERVEAYLNARGVFYRLEEVPLAALAEMRTDPIEEVSLAATAEMRTNLVEEVPAGASAETRTDPPKIVRQELSLAMAG